MNKVDWKKVQEKVMFTDKEILKKVIVKLDGHSIFDQEMFIEAGLDSDIVDAFLKRHYSGDHPK